MRRIGISFLGTALLSVSALASNAADLSGTWIVSAGFATPTCIFTQSGDYLRGTCEGPGAKGVAFGLQDTDMIRWTYYWVSKTDGNTGAFVFGGKVSPNGSLTGLVLNTNGLSSQFVAKRQLPSR